MKIKINNISQVFAIGDIHGCDSLLKKIHKKILNKSEKVKGKKTLIYLGDYIDRGSKVKETIDTIVNFRPKGFKCVFLRGNHDQMLLDFVNNKLDSLEIWLYNSGGETLKSYCGSAFTEELNYSSTQEQLIRKTLVKNLPSRHLKFFNDLQFFYIWKDYFFVHAGIDPNRSFGNQREIDMIWTRAPKFLASDQPFEKIVVHGHTPNENVEEKSNRINLDTGAVYTELGKLSCMCIDAKENRREFFSVKGSLL